MSPQFLTSLRDWGVSAWPLVGTSAAADIAAALDGVAVTVDDRERIDTENSRALTPGFGGKVPPSLLHGNSEHDGREGDHSVR